jgi:hypothetical protein
MRLRTRNRSVGRWKAYADYVPQLDAAFAAHEDVAMTSQPFGLVPCPKKLTLLGRPEATLSFTAFLAFPG